ncbi:MAG: ATP-binding cassette domain-containing protein [Microthrixaceae bacterium]
MAAETNGKAADAPERGPMVLLINDVDIDYEVWEDRRRGLRERFTQHQGSGRTVIHAVKGASFAVYEGESVAIMGSNGSGKSTILAAIAGLLPVTGGQIYAAYEPRLMGVGAALLPKVSGLRNVRIGCLALGMSTEQIDEHLDSIIEFADIGEAINRPLRSYSSGMKARLLFAIATSIRPKILMIDEALSVGDKEFRAKSEGRIQEMLASAGTLLMVSHNMAEIQRLCNRGIWLEEGVILADGPLDEVIDTYTKGK